MIIMSSEWRKWFEIKKRERKKKRFLFAFNHPKALDNRNEKRGQQQQQQQTQPPQLGWSEEGRKPSLSILSRDAGHFCDREPGDVVSPWSSVKLYRMCGWMDGRANVHHVPYLRMDGEKRLCHSDDQRGIFLANGKSSTTLERDSHM